MLKMFYSYSTEVKNLLPNRFYSATAGLTYYDILNVNKNCTNEEIRNSFLKLSKKHHPDVKGAKNDSKNTEAYLRIMEAYQVLSKKDSRRLYDLSLQNTINPNNKMYNSYHNKTDVGHKRETWRVTPDIDPNPGPYYGIRGIKKISNIKIVGVLLFIATIGTIIEFYLVRNSFTFRRDSLDEKSREAGLTHANIRADAEKYGNAKQIKRVTEKILRQN